MKDKNSCKVSYIYHLVETDSPEIVRYVGKSDDPTWRYKQHIREASKGITSKETWFANLLLQTNAPRMVIVGCFPEEKIYDIELAEIKKRSSEYLVNSVGNPKYKIARPKKTFGPGQDKRYKGINWNLKSKRYHVSVGSKYLLNTKTLQEALLAHDQVAKLLGMETYYYHDCKPKSPEEVRNEMIGVEYPKRKTKYSKYLGVSFNKKDNRWVAYIRESTKKNSFISTFKDEESASLWHDNVASYYGLPTSGNEKNPCSLERAKVLITRERTKNSKNVCCVSGSYRFTAFIFKGFPGITLTNYKTKEEAIKILDGLVRFYTEDGYTNFDSSFKISYSEAYKELKGYYPRLEELNLLGVPLDKETYSEKTLVKYVGVREHKGRNTFDAYLINPKTNKKIEIGTFKTPEEAARWRDNVAKFEGLPTNGFEDNTCSLERAKLLITRERYSFEKGIYKSATGPNYEIRMSGLNKVRMQIGGIPTKEQAVKLCDGIARYYNLPYTNYDNDYKVSFPDAYKLIKGEDCPAQQLEKYGLLEETPLPLAA
jgi:hypothetical protein